MLLKLSRYGCMFFFLSSMILSLLNLNPCIAQNNDEKVALDIYLLPEIKACRPNGYKKYDSYKKSECKPWSHEEIAGLEEYKVGHVDAIPPGDIPLKQDLFDRLVIYGNKNKDNVNNRRSILLEFTWTEPQNGVITLERMVGDNKEIPIYQEPIEEDFNGKNFIQHERADAFIPGYNIKWKLSLNGKSWTFYTENPHEKK